MKFYKTQAFGRLAKKAKVSDKELQDAADKIRAGRSDSNLGAHLVKQRVSEGQGGRSNSQRAIVFIKEGDRLTFVHLFAKNVQKNLTPKEEAEYRKAAKVFASLSDDKVSKLVKKGKWIEIENTSEEKGAPEE